MEVISYKNIKLNHIKLKKPILLYNSYNIYIKYNNNNLIVQTPIVSSPFGITQYGYRKYIDISLFDNNTEIQEFKTILSKFNNLLKKRIFNQKNLKLANTNNLQYCDIFKTSNPPYCDLAKFYFNNDIYFFNDNIEQIDSSNIKPKDPIKLLIHPSHIWINIHKQQYGIYWEVIQIKVYKLIVSNKCLFKEETEHYQKYFDLAKKGVPKQAIKNKMVIDGLDPNILDTYTGNVNPPKTNNIHNTPLLPILQKNTHNPFLAEIKKNNFNLKKNSNHENSDNSDDNDDNNTFKAPSLKQILNKLNNLKKI